MKELNRLRRYALDGLEEAIADSSAGIRYLKVPYMNQDRICLILLTWFWQILMGLLLH